MQPLNRGEKEKGWLNRGKRERERNVQSNIREKKGDRTGSWPTYARLSSSWKGECAKEGDRRKQKRAMEFSVKKGRRNGNKKIKE